jgi:hypothetical protein
MVKKEFLLFSKIVQQNGKVVFSIIPPYSGKNRGQKIGNIMEDNLGHRT